MRQKSEAHGSSEQVVKDIRRATRKQYSAEEKIRIVLDGLRGEYSIAELCRREGIDDSQCMTNAIGPVLGPSPPAQFGDSQLVEFVPEQLPDFWSAGRLRLRLRRQKLSHKAWRCVSFLVNYLSRTLPVSRDVWGLVSFAQLSEEFSH